MVEPNHTVFPPALLEQYERLRRLKMYRRNQLTKQMPFYRVLQELQGKPIERFVLRAHFLQVWSKDYPQHDLLKDYASEWLMKVFTSQRAYDTKLKVDSIHDDGNTSIYQLTLDRPDDSSLVRLILTKFLGVEALQFAAIVELLVRLTGGKVHESVFSSNYYRPLPTESFLLPHASYKQHYISTIPPSRFDFTWQDRWMDLVQLKWPEIERDVKGRALTVRCYQDGLDELITRRWFHGEPIQFTDREQASQIIMGMGIVEYIPNVHLLSDATPIEAVIDLDPPKDMAYEDIRDLSNHFAKWLTAKGFYYNRRATGGKVGGQHFIFPITLTEAPTTMGRPIRPERYIGRRSEEEILINTCKDAFFLLSLAYQAENKHYRLVRKTTCHQRDPVERQTKILFDIISDTNRGRRGIYSAHYNTGRVCVPLLNLPADEREHDRLCSIEQVIQNAEDYVDYDYSAPRYKEANLKALREIIETHTPLLERYVSANKFRYNWETLGEAPPGFVDEDET